MNTNFFIPKFSTNQVVFIVGGWHLYFSRLRIVINIVIFRFSILSLSLSLSLSLTLSLFLSLGSFYPFSTVSSLKTSLRHLGRSAQFWALLKPSQTPKKYMPVLGRHPKETFGCIRYIKNLKETYNSPKMGENGKMLNSGQIEAP